MYYKVRKNPLHGFNVNLGTSQMIAVIVLFIVFFVAPVVTYYKVTNKPQARVAGAYTSAYNSGKTENTKRQILTITRTAAIGSGLLLGACLVIVMNNNYNKHKIFEL